ncbi:hypothetical protein [Sulfurimonas sp.]
MQKNLEKIVSFLDNHHVMTLATSIYDEVSACSLFYAFDRDELSFIVASSDDTLHINHIKLNPKIAGNILLETQTIGKIKGVQFRGTMSELEDDKLKKIYFTDFPYARALLPKLWQIKVTYFKMTDNKLGFGKKIIFEPSSL